MSWKQSDADDYTYALMPVPEPVFKLITKLMEEAGYQHAKDTSQHPKSGADVPVLDMHGIAVYPDFAFTLDSMDPIHNACEDAFVAGYIAAAKNEDARGAAFLAWEDYDPPEAIINALNGIEEE